MRTRLLLLLTLPLTLLATRAHADPPDSQGFTRDTARFAPSAAPAAAPETSAPTALRDQTRFWQAEIGYRGSFVSDAGMNPFSTKDYLGQVTLGGTRTLFARGRFSFAAGVLWDYGRSTASARGADASLTVHRLAVPLEARFHPAPWLYFFARTAPSAVSLSARVVDASAPAPLAKSDWVPAIDLSAGAAWRFAAAPGANDARVGFWLLAEGGYGLAGSTRLLLSPDLADDDPRRTGSTELGKLALRGAFMRFGAALSF